MTHGTPWTQPIVPAGKLLKAARSARISCTDRRSGELLDFALVQENEFAFEAGTLTIPVTDSVDAMADDDAVVLGDNLALDATLVEALDGDTTTEMYTITVDGGESFGPFAAGSPAEPKTPSIWSNS